MAGNVEEYEHVQNPIDTTEIGNQSHPNQSHPTEPQNADTQHGWTDPTGGNMNPNYQGDTEPVDGGEVTVVTHFGDEVVGKVDRLINVVIQYGRRCWRRGGYVYFQDEAGNVYRKRIAESAALVDEVWYTMLPDGSCRVTIFYKNGTTAHGKFDGGGNWHWALG